MGGFFRFFFFFVKKPEKTRVGWAFKKKVGFLPTLFIISIIYLCY